MSAELPELVSPWRTAVVTSEVQNGVIGDQAALPALAEAARRHGAGPRPPGEGGARAGVEVVHAHVRPAARRQGLQPNARLFAGVDKSPVKLLPGSDAVRVVDEVGVEPTDLVLTRTHGLNPMCGHRPRRRCCATSA